MEESGRERGRDRGRERDGMGAGCFLPRDTTKANRRLIGTLYQYSANMEPKGSGGCNSRTRARKLLSCMLFVMQTS
jgi:hypothetical protein